MRNSVALQLGREWLFFERPIAVLQADATDDVVPLLTEIADRVERDGVYAAGFVSYEAAPAFDGALRVHAATETPLLWFGLYRQPVPVRPAMDGVYRIGRWHTGLAAPTFQRRVETIKAHIATGATYQVNYTFPLRARFTGSAPAFFRELVDAQQCRYGAYVDSGRFAVCSASPELFFRLDGTTVTTQPMKGTAARLPERNADRAQADALRASVKNRAENVMIVDMIRNDLGRIAHLGSVTVDRLFDVDPYPTLHQMTSTVSAETTASIPDLFRALFPCASITGAPKVRTMQLINELETHARGVYTGAIGFIAPNRQAQFNVAIRTVVIDREQQTARYDVGSGIVWDSDPAAEYEECLLKAQVLTRRRPAFDLLESLRYDPASGYALLERHLTRLSESAAYFGIPLDLATVQARLAEVAGPLTALTKVRLLVAPTGAIHATTTPIDAGPTELRLSLAAEPVDADTVFLYHKTTYRPMYDRALASRPECDDVILWNQRGDLTETAYGNLVLDLDGALVTPPVDAGLLPGTLRAHLLDAGVLTERWLTRDDLAAARAVWRINSVRGWQPGTVRDAIAEGVT